MPYVHMLCLDLEGVLIPEIWLAVADRTGLAALRLTTREVVNYDELMQHRLRVLDREGLKLPLIQEVISNLEPLPGAAQFLTDMRREYQVAILSDTFYEFAMPLMGKLGMPTLLCHHLEVDAAQCITGYRLRQSDPKRMAVRAFHAMGYHVVAAGDSFNDVPMLEEADAGLFFCAPDNVRGAHPQFTGTTTYAELAGEIAAAAAGFARSGRIT